MEKVNLGILGVSGHFMKRIAPALSGSEKINLYAIASRSVDKARNACEKFNIMKYYDKYDDVIKDKNTQLVYIPLPNNQHAEWIIKCADQGKHIICEKPIAMNTIEAEKAVTHAMRKKVYLAEDFMYKHHPQWVKVCDIVKSGEIGSINTIDIFFGYTNTDPANIRNIKESGGGALMDIGCYAVSVSRLLTGKEPVRTISLMKNDEAFKTDILTSAILDFGGGIRTTFTVGTKTFPFQKVEIFGTNGTITIHLPFNMHNDVEAEITVRTDTGERIIKTAVKDQYRLIFESIADCIINGKELPVSPIDAVNNMKAIDAIVKSAETNSWIEI